MRRIADHCAADEAFVSIHLIALLLRNEQFDVASVHRRTGFFRMRTECDRDVELFVAQEQGDEMDAYERLISSAMIGDTAHFARQDEVEAAWAIVEPVLGTDSPVYEYTPGTWGPREAEDIITVGPCNWHNPGAEAKQWTRSCMPGQLTDYAP